VKEDWEMKQKHNAHQQNRQALIRLVSILFLFERRDVPFRSFELLIRAYKLSKAPWLCSAMLKRDGFADECRYVSDRSIRIDINYLHFIRTLCHREEQCLVLYSHLIKR
jgi:hypothetical protein